MKYLYYVITGRHHGLFPALIRTFLTSLSWIYGLLVIVRGWLYDLRILKPKRLPCCVICVGNIVAGGTGKTPAAIRIAKHLQNAGFRPAILLRGYRRKKEGAVAVVSDGAEILTPPGTSGDEATLIASELPGVPVLVGKNRCRAGLEAIKLWNTQVEPREEPPKGVLILDDGFQHRQLAKDLEVVTVDGTQPFGTGKLLPAGTLREPVSALKRADVILLTRMDLTTSPQQVRAEIERFVGGKQIWESRHTATGLYQLGTDGEFELSLLKGQRVLAVCGIGNPEAFIETLRRYEPEHVDLLAFPDHHSYTPKDLIKIKSRADCMHADLIVITKKDAPKLVAFSGELRIFVLEIELEIIEREDAFKQHIQQAVYKTLGG